MKKVILIIVSLLLLATIPVVVWYAQQQQDIRSRAAPASRVSFSPGNVQVKTSDTSFTINVAIDTGVNQITGATVVVKFDPAVIEATDITVGNFFPDPAQVSSIPGSKKLDNTVGIAALGFYTIKDNAGNSSLSSEPLTTITFKPKAAGTSTVEFDTLLTKVTGFGEETNVLVPGGAGGTATVTVTNDAPSPTATSTPTPTPTQAPGGESSPTPTPTPTTSASRSPTPTPTPRSDIPVTGDATNTLLIVGAAVLLIVIGAGGVLLPR